MADFDLIVIGSGPGGYVSAIRASQLGMNDLRIIIITIEIIFFVIIVFIQITIFIVTPILWIGY